MRAVSGLTAVVLAASSLLVPAAEATAAPEVVTVTSATIVHEPNNLMNNTDGAVSAFGASAVRVKGFPVEAPRTLVFEIDPAVVEPAGRDRHYELRFVLPTGHAFEEGTYIRPRGSWDDDEVVPTFGMTVDSSACDGIGEATIHELAPDLSRVWVTFKLWCGTQADGASYGEIRVGMEAPSVDGLVAPAIAAWPEAEVGEPGFPVSWPVQNPTSDPIPVGDPYVTGPHAGDFVIGSSSCGSVPAGGRCHVPVVFTPSGEGVRRAVLRLPVGANGEEVTMSLSGLGMGGHTSMEIDTKLPSGRYYRDDGPAAHLYVRNSSYGNGVFIASYKYGSYARFLPPEGESLQVGRRYTDVPWTGSNVRTKARIDTGLSSNDCAEFRAEFTVLELGYIGDQPASFAVRFDVVCTNWDDRGFDLFDRGVYAWRATSPAPRITDPPLTNPDQPDQPAVPPVSTAADRAVLRISTHRRTDRPGQHAKLRFKLVGTTRRTEAFLRIKHAGRPQATKKQLTLRPGTPKVRRIRVDRRVVVRARLAGQPWSQGQVIHLAPRRGHR